MKIITEKARIDDIADAVRQKLNVETQYKLSEIPAAIDNIYVGGELEPLSATANGDYTPGTGIEGFSRVHVAVPDPTLVTKNIVSNGTYDASQDNADGYSAVTVNVPGYATIESLEVTENGTYNPPSGVDGYAPVTVNVSGSGAVVQPLNVTQNGDYYPSSGTDGFDEVHVSVPGATLTTKSITQNGTYNASSDNADGYSSVVVNVSGGGGGAVVQPLNVTQNGDYFPPTGTDGFNEVHVSVSGGYPEPTGTIPITANGTVNVKDYETAQVNVPNSYAASDEGKVVKNSALVAQTARATEITANGIYDTTENNSVTVNVSGGGGAVVQPLSVSENGTYNPPSGVDGYAPVTVNVSGGGASGINIFGLFNMTTRKEGSMSWQKTASSLKVTWNGGASIGADSFVMVDLTDASSISVDVATGSSYTDTRVEWYIYLALMDIDPNTITNPAMQYQTYFKEYDEFHTRNSSATLTIDVSNYTGLNYLLLSPVGWNAEFTNLVVE